MVIAELHHGPPAEGGSGPLPADRDPGLSRDREVDDPGDVSRQEIVKELRRAGLADAASAAETSLPDPVDTKVSGSILRRIRTVEGVAGRPHGRQSLKRRADPLAGQLLLRQ